MSTTATRPPKHRVFIPSTPSGHWAAGLLTLGIAAFGAFFSFVAAGERGGDTFFSNLWLTISIFFAASSTIASGVAGLFAAFRHRDHSLVVLTAIAFGTVTAFFFSGEILFPH